MLKAGAPPIASRIADSDVYAVVDDALSPDIPLGTELEVFVRREDAERFIEEVRATTLISRRSCGSRSAN